jgi:hypothetical protein
MVDCSKSSKRRTNENALGSQHLQTCFNGGVLTESEVCDQREGWRSSHRKSMEAVASEIPKIDVGRQSTEKAELSTKYL